MKKVDLIVIAVVLAVAGVLFFFLYGANSDSGKYVQVEVNGEIVDTLKLDEDFEKQYDFNGETNTLVIKNGKADVIEANCKDKYCVNQKPINLAGESIICLPHKMVVSVVDELNDSEIDAVA